MQTAPPVRHAHRTIAFIVGIYYSVTLKIPIIRGDKGTIKLFSEIFRTIEADKPIVLLEGKGHPPVAAASAPAGRSFTHKVPVVIRDEIHALKRHKKTTYRPP
jgi:hypothetical protein